MRRQRDIFQSREEDKASEKELIEIEIINVPNKEFKVMVKKDGHWTWGEEWINSEKFKKT